MRVLAVIPTHDRTEFYREAIDSVYMQTRQADELVVTGNVGPGINTNDSLADRLNHAISRSNCEAFVILCDDDQLKPDFIERTARLMEESGVDIVYTDCSVFGDRDCEAYALGEWNQVNIDRNTVPLVTTLCTKAAWQRAGGFEDVPLFDWDFWWKCFHTGATAKWLKAPLFRHRDHGSQAAKQIDRDELRRIIQRRHRELKAKISSGGRLCLTLP